MNGKRLPTIPDSITLLNLLLGFMAILFILEDKPTQAASMILLAVLADIFDGFLARRNGSVSRFGRELDSLADLVSFGVAPGVILYTLFTHPKLAVFSAIIPVCGALRLARFNVMDDKSGFTGLPIPAAGGFIASLVFLGVSLNQFLLVALTVMLSALMVSEIRYFKYSSKGGSKPFMVYLLAISTVIGLVDERMLVLPFIIYTLSGLSGLNQ
ncbi:MAG: CDP-diacylglycerol--serine O-phosphatidyltransferase [Methanobacteriota archaeon]